MTNVITIKKLYDEYDCDDCGLSYEEGFIAYLNGVEICRLEPYAHCYDCVGIREDEEMYRMILEKLGYSVESIRHI